MWVAAHLTGGLGNRLFQHAAAAGLAEKWGRELVFFLPRCGPTNHGAFDTIFRLFPHVSVVETATEWTSLAEEKDKLFRYCPFPDISPPTNCVIQGYRQSEKYFPSAGIRLAFENVLVVEALRLEEPEKQWFVHVRLGDYKILPHHQEELSGYYLQCLREVPPGHTVTLYSDEPELCESGFREAARTYGITFRVSKEKDELVSLYMMSQCRGGTIAANSTFSWWASYLAYQGGCRRSFFPSNWGQGLPPPVDLLPRWASVVPL